MGSSSTTVGTHFKIQLENPTIILSGAPEQTASRLLRGNLLLYLRASIRVKSIKLRLLGQMKLQWHETTKKRTLIDHEWVFLESSKQGLHYIEAGTHSYPFELLLPGHLPDTIEDSSYGQIFYKLKAVAIRTGFSSNLTTRESLQIYRVPSTMNSNADRRGFYNSSGDTRAARVSGRHEDILTYEVDCRQKVFQRGDRVSAKVHLWPHDSDTTHESETASHYCWTIRSISCILKEITTFDDMMVSNLHRDDKADETRILRFIKEETFPPFIENHYQKSIKIPIPRYTKYDTTNEFLNIVHQLQLTIALVNKTDGRFTELRVTLPIMVVHGGLIEALQLADDDLLPSYDDARRSAPYVPDGEDITQQYFQQQGGSSLSSSPLNTPINTAVGELDGWLSMPIVCDNNPPLYDITLPPYETTISLVIPHHTPTAFIQ